MVKLYTLHCSKCKVIERKLEQKGIPFEMIDDNDTVVAFGLKNNINSMPLLELEDGSVLDFSAANKWMSSPEADIACSSCEA